MFFSWLIIILLPIMIENKTKKRIMLAGRGLSGLVFCIILFMIF